MKCRVCGCEVELGQICMKCGFPNMSIVGEKEESKEEINHLVATFRQRLIGTAEVSIVVYEWRILEDKVEKIGSRAISFPSCSNLELGKTVWLDTKIARVPNVAEVELNLEIKTVGDQKLQRKVKMPVPQEQEYWLVGISLEEGLKIRLHLKNQQSETQSPLIDVM